MKKLLFSIGLSAFAMTAGAQQHLSQSLLGAGIRALATGTNGQGGGGITNLSLLITNAGLVHGTNFVYTNNSGSVVRSSGLTNQFSTVAPFNTVPLFADRNGGLPVYQQFVAGSLTNYHYLSPLSLVLELANPFGTNGPVGIVLAPVWKQGGITVSRGDDWAVVIPGNATARQSIVTNVPTWRWPGAYGLTIRYITNEFGAASSAATYVTNCPWLTRADIVGFKP